MKKIILSICLFLTIMAFSNISSAQEASQQQVYLINKGTPAPVDGYILTQPSMSSLIARYTSQKQIFDEQLRLEIKHTQDVEQAQCEKALADKHVMLTSSIAIRDEELKSQTKKINVLTTHIAKLEKQSTPNLWLYISGGVAGGVLTTLATIFIVNHI